jgi:hypothetical protein
MERLRAPLRFCLLALFSSTPATAHNTAVAVAVPVVDITVDGDFADWPQDAPRHDIQLIEYGQAPTGRRDLTASFRLCCNGSCVCVVRSVFERARLACAGTERRTVHQP